jgi:hypothetical protein
VSPFEKFIREFAEKNPTYYIGQAIEGYDSMSVRYSDDPVRWALQLDDMELLLKDGYLVKAVKLIRDQQDGPFGLKECKDLAMQVRAALGIAPRGL